MPDDDKNARHKMNKRVETKEDGRILIYYTFETRTETAQNDAQQPVPEKKEVSK